MLTKLTIDLPDVKVVQRTTGGLWRGKIGARPGLFSLGDMTGYVFNNFAGP